MVSKNEQVGVTFVFTVQASDFLMHKYIQQLKIDMKNQLEKDPDFSHNPEAYSFSRSVFFSNSNVK